MSKPILKKHSANKLNSASSSISSSSTAAVTFVTTLPHTFTTIWDESRLFLQTRFQIPHVSHVLLMQQPDLVQRNRDLVAILEYLSSIVDKLKPHEVILYKCLFIDTHTHTKIAQFSYSLSFLC